MKCVLLAQSPVNQVSVFVYRVGLRIFLQLMFLGLFHTLLKLLYNDGILFGNWGPTRLVVVCVFRLPLMCKQLHLWFLRMFAVSCGFTRLHAYIQCVCVCMCVFAHLEPQHSSACTLRQCCMVSCRSWGGRMFRPLCSRDSSCRPCSVLPAADLVVCYPCKSWNETSIV